MIVLENSLHLVFPVLEELATARSLSVAIMLRYKEYTGILSLKTDPRHYVDAEKYFRDVQATSLLKKCRDLVIPGVDRSKAASLKWLEGERDCYKSNERLSKFIYGGVSTPGDLVIDDFLSSVRKKILSWIGPCPPDLDKIEGRFGPGATFADRGRLTAIPDKLVSNPTLTHHAYWYLLPFVQTMWGRNFLKRDGEVSWVRGNRFLTVPKTALIDRAIAVEPAINVFYQLGLGTSIRRRLRNATGWDLDNAQDIHRLLAKESSSSREFATLDLSNASDTVCINLVRLCMPPRWYEELFALRSPFTLFEGKWRRLEKFSSMGNGYTFELETLLFAALLTVSVEKCGGRGVLGEDVFVFGDDIIIPDQFVSPCSSMLRFFGFSLNQEKSFSGSVGFRESCGGDFFEGADVRPYYLKEFPNEPVEAFPVANGLCQMGERLSRLSGSDCFASVRYWISWLPSNLRYLRGPKDLGDCVLHYDPGLARFRWKDSIRYYRTLQAKPRYIPWSHWDPDTVLACAVYGTGDGRLGVLPRGLAPLGYYTSWVAYS